MALTRERNLEHQTLEYNANARGLLERLSIDMAICSLGESAICVIVAGQVLSCPVDSAKKGACGLGVAFMVVL
ncbi:hypothetical protein PsYK624_150360 [Phanerochaete sordida]|uniref:Uncharacterized protein n=1 Tax=Phanerochaete sordida TaxID=48140 RepID=A0A9P3LLK8_9APHY|nr:hypothetical protein PsYK624_150360 [Phanerochaete sordida]